MGSFKSAHCYTCPFFFKLLNSCPDMAIFEKGELEDIIIEMIMSFSSAIAYFAFFIVLAYGLKVKTVRGFCISSAIILQVFACEIFKAIHKQARPYGSCADSYGYPSSHTSFTSTLLTWLIMELIFAQKDAKFKSWKWNSFWRNAFILYSPLVPISRSYLNYHTLEQIVVGFISGAVFAILFYLYVHFTIFATNNMDKSPLGKYWKKYNYVNNMVEEDEAAKSIKIE